MTTFRHKKVTVSIAPGLADAVDEYVRQNPGTKRSHIYEKALQIWIAEKDQRELKEYYESLSEEEKGGNLDGDQRSISDKSTTG